MANKKTKRALLLSALSLLICVTMLIGSTFAWFTDNASASGNKIVSGDLDVQLLMHNGTEYVDVSGLDKPIFGSGSIAQNMNSETLWEPGKTQIAYLAIKNNGNLALQYKVILEVFDITNSLYEVMEYAIVNDAQPESVNSWDGGTPVEVGKQNISTDIPMGAGATHYFALAIHMKESAGNDYENGEVAFDLTILATQVTAENDSFGNSYDANATYPIGKPSLAVEAYEDINFKALVDIPAEAPEGEYELVVPKESVEITNDNGIASMSFEMDLMRDGTETSALGLEWPVTIQLPHGFLSVKEIVHNGETITDFSYDKATNTVSFVTKHFSPFEIKYVDYIDHSYPFEYEVVNAETNQYKITKGIFIGKNPADYDKSLKEDNSKYIVVDYVKDGVKYYVVSERAKSVFFAADATDKYVGVNGTFNAENVDFRSNQSGKMWALFNKDQANNIESVEHAIVYLLPGTYNEGTTINISSSVDVIGLGDTNEVKVVKLSSSSSNRHLFNCNNASKADYIEVTLRNLYLDATALTTNNKDNAAVQSIRKSKVKCYDLTIIKGSGFSDIAFYVNGNNAHDDGTKYPAYLYASNCTLNTTKSYCIVSTAGSYKFFHNNIKYGAEGELVYSTNSGSILNKTMEANDWIWD